MVGFQQSERLIDILSASEMVENGILDDLVFQDDLRRYFYENCGSPNDCCMREMKISDCGILQSNPSRVRINLHSSIIQTPFPHHLIFWWKNAQRRKK